MKRYALFEFENYYPQGGWFDFVESFDSVNDAVDYYRLPRPRPDREYDYRPSDNFHVIDLQTGEVVSED